MTKSNTTGNAGKNNQVTTLDDEPQDAVENVVVKTAAGAVVAGANYDDSLSGEREILTIHSTGQEGEKNWVFLSHNGFAYQVPRGKACNVPAEVAQILRDAVTRTFHRNDAGAIEPRDSYRFPFSASPAPAAAATAAA